MRKKKWLLFQGCSWTESLLVSKAYTLLIRAPEILKPWSHRYWHKQITGEFVYSREDQCLLASEIFGNKDSNLIRHFFVSQVHRPLSFWFRCFISFKTPFWFLCFIHCVKSPSFRYSLKAMWKDRAWMRTLEFPTPNSPSRLKNIILVRETISSIYRAELGKKHSLNVVMWWLS